METNFVVYAILVIAVLLLVNRVIKLRRRNEELTNEIVLGKQILKGERWSTDKINSLRLDLSQENNRLLNELNELKGNYSKELKKVELLATNRLSEINNLTKEKNRLLNELKELESENKVLIAKCEFLEACNEEVVRRKQAKRKKGDLVKEVEKLVSKFPPPFSFGYIMETIKCNKSSLTHVLNSLVKQGKLKKVKHGWYQWKHQ